MGNLIFFQFCFQLLDKVYAVSNCAVSTSPIQSSSLPPDSALPCVAFPWYHGKDLVKVRLETIPPTEEVQPSREGVWGVFGWGTVEPASREVGVCTR